MCLVAYLVYDVLECIQLLLQLELDDFLNFDKSFMKNVSPIASELVELFRDGNFAAPQVTS
jgi:hypothetical protein